MKQTAVEWLIEQWPILESQLPTWLIEQAKEMEKQQIIESYCQGCFDMWKDDGIVPRETSDKYYNETFKSE
jgi:Leu/Phe-tRNA-protein transferase